MRPIKKLIRTQLDRVAKRLDYVRRSQIPRVPLPMHTSLDRTLSRDLGINSVIDVGASNGEWSNLCLPLLPQAEYLLVEANPIHEAALKTYVADKANVRYTLVAAGNYDGNVYFDARDPLGGVASNEEKVNYIELPARRIDSLVREYELQAPYLLKLDTHGFEIPIFEGAGDILADTNLIVVEVYNYQIQEDSLLFYEICDYLAQRGFRTVDMAQPTHRTYDNTLWQMDLFFIRDDRPEFKYLAFE